MVSMVGTVTGDTHGKYGWNSDWDKHGKYGWNSDWEQAW